MHPHPTKIEMSLSHLIGIVRGAIVNDINQSFSNAGYKVNTQQFVVLMFLWEKDGQNQQYIATKTNRDKASVARLLLNMEKKGLIKRKISPYDNRQKLIWLTKIGKSIKEDILKILKNRIEFIQRGIDEKELQVCKRALYQVYENLTLVKKQNNKI